jgi:hypothetical protein
MNADLTQTLVAKCLTDPAFVSTTLGLSHRASDELHNVSDIDADTEQREAIAILGAATLERLRLFQGLITKVKHNPLRAIIPYTFRFLVAIRCEIAFFASYSIPYVDARTMGPLTVDKQLDLLDQHFSLFFDSQPLDIRRAACEVLRHELCVRRVRIASEANDRRYRTASVRWRGSFETQSFETDVLSICANLNKGQFTPPIDAGVRRLAYWRTSGATAVSVCEIDEVTSLIFSLVDGLRTVENIADVLNTMGLFDIEAADLSNFFADAVGRGFVEINKRGN